MPSREVLQSAVPQLTADVKLYPTTEGGRESATQPGWGCPCVVSKSPPFIGYDGWPLLQEPLHPGESRRVGFIFLSGEEAAKVFGNAGIFYLWEGRLIGEAAVVSHNG